MTQTNNPTNAPYLRYLVEAPIGTNPIPIRLEYAAYGNRGFELTGWLDNTAAGVRAAIPDGDPDRGPGDTPAR
ncbi:hypothetical protein [Streptomyces sp. NPDC052721]|uniref:hypothetical protein n=1 Tax=Streptomyces sp. NPDC052721 TaxID=3154955 RepID=UPI00341DEC06